MGKGGGLQDGVDQATLNILKDIIPLGFDDESLASSQLYALPTGKIGDPQLVDEVEGWGSVEAAVRAKEQRDEEIKQEEKIAEEGRKQRQLALQKEQELVAKRLLDAENDSRDRYQAAMASENALTVHEEM